VPAAPLHVPPLAFARFASDKLTPRKDVVATTKLLIGLLLVLLGYTIAILVVGWKINLGTAIGLAILLPISGWATLRVLDRLRLVRRGFGVLFRRLAFRREVLALRREREQLVANVVATVSAVKPAEVEAMFPADHPDRAKVDGFEDQEVEFELDFVHEESGRIAVTDEDYKIVDKPRARAHKPSKRAASQAQ